MSHKNRKRIKLIAAGIILLLLAVDLVGANYLVSFAVGRTTSGGVAVVPPPSTTSETRNTVNENYKLMAEKTAQWREQQESEIVTLTSFDGLKLTGEVFRAQSDSHNWAILVHGYSTHRKSMMDYAVMYADKGFNLLLPDLKGHGDSEGDYIGMGWPDRKDMLGWIEMICSWDPEAKIVLHGVSMGAATVLMTSGEALPANVQAIVEDCGYTSVQDIFADELDVLFHLPQFPLLPTASLICKLRAGYTFPEASALEQVKNAEVPILFIHGSEDNFVHTEMVYRLYDACPSEKEIFVVQNAGHGQSYLYAPEEYKAAVFRFLEQHIAA